MLQKKIFFEGATEITDEHRKAVSEAYGIIEKFLDNNDWIAGDTLSIADFTFASSISSCILLVPLVNDKYPKLNAWLEKIKKHPVYDANRPGLLIFEGFVKSKLGN